MTEGPGADAPGSSGAEACEGIELELAEGIATLVLRRPGKVNALPVAAWRALPGIVAELDARRDVRVLVLRGAGGDFSAGSDIRELPEDLAEFWRLNSAAVEALERASVPTIAAVRGIALGGGTELAAACDIRIAQRDARFGIPAARLGIVYPPGPTRALARVIGPARARYLLLTAEVIGAERALGFGLVDELADDALGRASELAARVAGLSDLSQQAACRILASEDPVAEELADLYAEELAEGRRAFRERSAPGFPFRRQDWPRA